MSDTPNSTGGRLLDKYAGPLVAHLLLIGLWQVVASLPSMPTYILPSPLETLATLGDEGNDWIANTAVTATEIVGGFVIAVIVGVAIALIFSWSRRTLEWGMPLLVTLNMIPKVALGPIIIVWMSYGISTNTVIAFTISNASAEL